MQAKDFQGFGVPSIPSWNRIDSWLKQVIELAPRLWRRCLDGPGVLSLSKLRTLAHVLTRRLLTKVRTRYEKRELNLRIRTI